MNAPPVLAADLFRTRRGNRHLFLNPGIPDWLVVDDDGAYALGLCTGTQSPAAIAAQAASARGMGPDAVAAVLDKAGRHGLFASAGPSGAAPSADPAGTCTACHPVCRQRRAVHVVLTNRCNLRCSACYTESGRSAGILSLIELTDLASDIERQTPAAALDWVLSGGEPLLHPACLDFAAHLKVKGHTVSLLTNGTLVTAATAPRLAADCDLVTVSLDGSREEVHARTRGSGNRDTVVRAIEMLLEAGAAVAVATVVHRHNRDDLPALAARYGARLRPQPFIAVGRGAAAAELALTGEEYHAVLSAIPGAWPPPGVRPVLAAARGHGIRKCAAGAGEISVDETGDVYPCRMLHRPDCKAGSIRRQPLAEILRAPVFDRLARLSVESRPDCAGCPVRLVCGGACRARPLHGGGSEDGADSFCAFDRRAYLDGMLDFDEA